MKYVFKDFFVVGRLGVYVCVLLEGMIEVGMIVDYILFDGLCIMVVENMQVYQDKFCDYDFLCCVLEVFVYYKLYEIVCVVFE